MVMTVTENSLKNTSHTLCDQTTRPAQPRPQVMASPWDAAQVNKLSTRPVNAVRVLPIEANTFNPADGAAPALPQRLQHDLQHRWAVLPVVD